MKKVDKPKLTTVDFLELMLNWNALVLCEERPKTAVIILLPAIWMETITVERERRRMVRALRPDFVLSVEHTWL